MFSEDDLLPISALQHLLFCERQWGLIHLEQQWEENRLTAEGRSLHERVHESATETRPGVVIARGLHLHSLRLGLSGQADVVEFHSACDPAGAVVLEGRPGWWRPFPIEYKRGKPKSDGCDEVQLCAQAICLEEMFGTSIEAGALFYGLNRRRTAVPFDEELRIQTTRLTRRMHALDAAAITPSAEYAKKCDRCSLYSLCLPRTLRNRISVARYLTNALKDEETSL